MSFLTPFFLLLGLLAGPIILLYMLRLRRREVVVSSTLLWQKLLRDREANAPWQRLRRNLLLILQLIILSMLVLALARPFLPVARVVNGNVVVLLDGSASMLATDVEASRFAVAQAEVRTIVNQLSGDDQMTLILVNHTPEVLLSGSNDRRALLERLEVAEARPTTADWRSAVALASGAAQGYEDATIVIVSDGGLPADLPPLAAPPTFIGVGTSAENLAITALASQQNDAAVALFAQVTNYGRLDQGALIAVDVDGALFDAQQISVPAGSSTNVSWSVPADSKAMRAQLSQQTSDFLAADDTAWTVQSAGLTSNVALIGEGNLFLEQALRVLPSVTLFTASPTEPVDERADLLIYDGVPLPDPLPDRDMLIVNPVGSNGLLRNSGVFSDTATTRIVNDPLLEFVEWGDVNIRQATAIEPTFGRTFIAAGDDRPLLHAGERNGHRIAILSFDIRDSDLPLQIAFPILIANLVDWLNPGQAFDTTRQIAPGDALAITPDGNATDLAIRLPDGSEWRSEIDGAQPIFADTEQLGLYEITMFSADGERSAGQFPINLTVSAESNIAPNESLQLGYLDIEEQIDRNVGQRELWPWLAALAFLVLIVEWWVHFRGTSLPWQQLRPFRQKS